MRKHRVFLNWHFRCIRCCNVAYIYIRLYTYILSGYSIPIYLIVSRWFYSISNNCLEVPNPINLFTLIDPYADETLECQLEPLHCIDFTSLKVERYLLDKTTSSSAIGFACNAFKGVQNAQWSVLRCLSVNFKDILEDPCCTCGCYEGSLEPWINFFLTKCRSTDLGEAIFGWWWRRGMCVEILTSYHKGHNGEFATRIH